MASLTKASKCQFLWTDSLDSKTVPAFHFILLCSSYCHKHYDRNKDGNKDVSSFIFAIFLFSKDVLDYLYHLGIFKFLLCIDFFRVCVCGQEPVYELLEFRNY